MNNVIGCSVQQQALEMYNLHQNRRFMVFFRDYHERNLIVTEMSGHSSITTENEDGIVN